MFGSIAESLTLTEKQYFPATAGVQEEPVRAAELGMPENCPFVALKVSPGGKLPAAGGDTDHVIGATPPLTFTAWLYCVFRFATGNDPVVIERGGAFATFSEYCCVTGAAPPLSVTCTVNVTGVGLVPPLHGFPAIAVDVLVVFVTVRFRHTEDESDAGLLFVIANVYG